MAELLDTVSRQLSLSIESKRGIAALLNSSADSEQSALDACVAITAERDKYKRMLEDKCDECDDLRTQLAKAEALIAQLTQRPTYNLTVRDNGKVERLITGDLHEYVEDDSNTGQFNRGIGTGRQALP